MGYNPFIRKPASFVQLLALVSSRRFFLPPDLTMFRLSIPYASGYTSSSWPLHRHRTSPTSLPF
jgi:hypothetical protein